MFEIKNKNKNVERRQLTSTELIFLTNNARNQEEYSTLMQYGDMMTVVISRTDSPITNEVYIPAIDRELTATI